MKVIQRDLWLCEDCVPVAVNGEYSHLDYHYDEEEAAQRVVEIDNGLRALPGLVPDDGDDECECRSCGHCGGTDDFKIIINFEDEYDGRLCPDCGSDDTQSRDSGQEEFSRRECDCCGSNLAGTRMRFAQLGNDTPAQEAP